MSIQTISRQSPTDQMRVSWLEESEPRASLKAMACSLPPSASLPGVVGMKR